MAFASVLWAQALAGSGVGTAAAALADADAAGATDGAVEAGGAADAADAAALGALLAVDELHALTTRMAVIARAGSLSCALIQSSSNASFGAAGLRPTLRDAEAGARLP
jgi:hypothetical protein